MSDEQWQTFVAQKLTAVERRVENVERLLNDIKTTVEVVQHQLRKR